MVISEQVLADLIPAKVFAILCHCAVYGNLIALIEFADLGVVCGASSADVQLVADYTVHCVDRSEAEVISFRSICLGDHLLGVRFENTDRADGLHKFLQIFLLVGKSLHYEYFVLCGNKALINRFVLIICYDRCRKSFAVAQVIYCNGIFAIGDYEPVKRIRCALPLIGRCFDRKNTVIGGECCCAYCCCCECHDSCCDTASH